MSRAQVNGYYIPRLRNLLTPEEAEIAARILQDDGAMSPYDLTTQIEDDRKENNYAPHWIWKLLHRVIPSSRWRILQYTAERQNAASQSRNEWAATTFACHLRWRPACTRAILDLQQQGYIVPVKEESKIRLTPLFYRAAGLS
jgi:hypothetical protein